mgnify:CR=1 FL=1
MKTALLFVFIAFYSVYYSQTDNTEAQKKFKDGVDLFDAGKYEDAIKMFKEAQKLDPQSSAPQYEIALTYSVMKKYEDAIEILEKIKNKPDAEDSYWSLLGSCYDLNDDRDKAFEIYEAGLKKFPKSGRLYLEMGVTNAMEKEYDKALQSYFQPYLNQLCPDCQERFERKPRRILDCKVKECKDIAKNAPIQLDYLDEPCKEHFSEVQHYLNLMHIPFVINPRIVRGLDYYTNTAFEVIYEGIGAQNALAGGGRYNGLLEQIGGKNIPAVGFAGGFERLLLSLNEEKITLPSSPFPEVFIVTIGREAQELIIPYLNVIRREGIYAEYEPDRASLKAQLKAANNYRAHYALIIGETEVKQKSAMLKNLESGEQKLYPLQPISDLINAIQNKEL